MESVLTGIILDRNRSNNALHRQRNKHFQQSTKWIFDVPFAHTHICQTDGVIEFSNYSFNSQIVVFFFCNIHLFFIVFISARRCFPNVFSIYNSTFFEYSFMERQTKLEFHPQSNCFRSIGM